MMCTAHPMASSPQPSPPSPPGRGAGGEASKGTLPNPPRILAALSLPRALTQIPRQRLRPSDRLARRRLGWLGILRGVARLAIEIAVDLSSQESTLGGFGGAPGTGRQSSTEIPQLAFHPGTDSRRGLGIARETDQP